MKRILASIAVSALPLLALAQPGINQSPVYTGGGIVGLLQFFGGILRMILPLIISVAVVWFVYNVFQYTIASNEEDKGKSKTQIVYGIIGIFVMVSVWGLVRFLGVSLNLDNQVINAPTIQVP